jgi:hypothetical protein
MRRDARLLGAAAVALICVAVPVALVWRVLPPSDQEQVVADVGDVTAVPMEQRPVGVQRMVVKTPAYPKVARARIEVRVGTYGRTPSEPVRLVFRDGGGRHVASCRISPSDYVDNGNVGCLVSRADRVRQIAISARGRAPLAVYVASVGSARVAGTLVRDLHFKFGARLRQLDAQVGVTRPVLFSPPIVLAALVISTALFATAVVILVRSERAPRDRVTDEARFRT